MPDSGTRISLCVLCGEEATGCAFIGDDRYCHGDLDSDPTCYMRGQWRLMSPGQREQFAAAIPGFALIEAARSVRPEDASTGSKSSSPGGR